MRANIDTKTKSCGSYRSGLALALVGGCLAWRPAVGNADWGNPLTAPSSRFGQACPSGGWAELHDSFLPEQPNPPPNPSPLINYMPVFCPRSFNDYTANHTHGALHATGFLHSDNGFYGIYDGNGNVFGSSDIAIRLDPTNFFANPNESQGFVDMWIHRNARGLIVRNPHDVRSFSGSPQACAGVFENPKSITNEFKTARHVQDTCAPPSLRKAKEPAVATLYAGFFTTTYVAWLERDQAKFNTPPASLHDHEKAWKVYVAAVSHNGLNAQQQDPVFLAGGQPFGGALNRDALRDAHSPKIAVVAGVPWVIWAEDRPTDLRDTHVKAWENNTWVNKGDVNNTGESKNCYTSTVGPGNAGFASSSGYSVDIAGANTFLGGELPVIVSVSEVAGECRPVVRMFLNGAWTLVGASGGTYPGEASGLVGNGVNAATPRIFGTPTGDVFVTWKEGSNVYASTVNVALGPVVAWKDLAGPYPGGHWGAGSFPSLAVTPLQSGGTEWHMLSIASKKGTNVSVDRALVGMVNNTSGNAQKTLWPTVGGNANVTTDGKGKSMIDPNAWDAPTNIVPATNGQVGVFDNYLMFIQRGDDHRAQDTGVFIRRGF